MTTLPPARYGAPLSVLELQVLAGIARGRTYAQIGFDLGLSAVGVRAHARRLMAKLGARDRAHAVGIGYQAGLLGGRAAGRGGRWVA